MLEDVPFTISHLAAVVPLRSGRTRVEALPTAPLVIGAMVPDLPAVLGAADLRPATHTGPFALVLDLVLTAVVWCAWVAAVRPAVVATLPGLAARWHPVPRRRPAVVWWVAAAVVGAASHLLWDACTHSGEGTTWFEAFAGQERVFFVLQLASSAVGLLVVLAWVRQWWLRTPVTAAVAERRPWLPRRLAAAVVLLGVVGGGIWRWQHAASQTSGPASGSLTVGEVVFGTLAGALLAVAVLTTAFWVRRWLVEAPSDDEVERREPTSEQVPG
ncbi:DUF4184 family protein [Angustibacter sp. Root456]|uniref:DUF4184 family protein n=1 Tax=Angustibacter sp. Root456 TaxID=1736539 RepID=UPI0006F22C31|nr:DUF4184 family protein [Angustibacter sp. Root456]KQX66665.1 hypothetical protein ASD06_04765 [Angustibacter sp. Root456]